MKPYAIQECGLAVLQLVKLTKPTRALLEQRLVFTLNAMADQFTYLNADTKALTRDDPFERWLVCSRWCHQFVEPTDRRILRELFYGIIPHAQDADGVARVCHHYRTPHKESIPAVLQYLAAELPETALEVA